MTRICGLLEYETIRWDMMRLQPSKYKYIKVIAITGATITVEVWVLNLSSYQLLNTTFGTGTGWLPGQRLKAYGFVELFSGEAWRPGA